MGLLVKSTMIGRPFVLFLFLLIDFIFTACSTSTPTSTPISTSPTSTLIPPPVQGPAVLGDNVEIKDWEYLGPESVESFPSLSANVREVGDSEYEIRLIRTDYGFDLVWTEFPCATQPVVIVHADAVIEFWPGDRTEEPCEAMSVGHMLTVQWDTDIPFEQWKFTLHPPPLPKS